MAGMLVTMERRRLMELIPETIRKFWKIWQLRFLVFVSLFLQIALISLGKVRKRHGKPVLRFIIWSAYLLADWVATLGLGVILNRVQEHPNKDAPIDDDLISFWAPFLLLHLGGPDTITAYSLEDNQLWQRRVLELVTQLSVVVYILIVAWPGKSFLSLLTMLMLLAGVVKFGERIYSLRSASTDQFRFSQMTEPEPGPNYSKFMEEFTLKKAEGFYMRAIEVIETPLPTHASISISNENEDLVLKACDLFRTFKRLFVDLILSFQDRDKSQRVFHNLGYEKAFEVIEIELGFAYDVFYTKAPVAYNRRGHIFRLFTLLATLSSLVAFIVIHRVKKDHYNKVDLIITYLLLVVAIILEICSYLILLFSDWSDHWVKKHYKQSIISSSRHLFRVPRKEVPRKRWSNSIAQYSIQIFCREQKSSKFPQFLKLLMAENKVDELYYLTYTGVSNDLKDLIFEYFSKISKSGDKSQFSALCTSRGKRVLDGKDCSDLNWSTTEIEFDQSILLWHIATDLCYHIDDGSTNLGEEINSERTESKHMSEYMMYLLALRPFMLPMGIGMIRLRDTCAEARDFFKEQRQQPNKAQACRMLLRVNTEIQPGKVKGDRSKSVLFDACRLATELLSKKGQAWEIISQVWVEILAYAACHCRGTHHAQQLRKGGEFLTHVWLLMAHLGITEQFQISQGHARAKLGAK
uniref:DUF4220 domain-containing protein n=2 Tax=Chenopodium quinoa TaxID=63459 RepID=A0A803ND95_CHEQI